MGEAPGGRVWVRGAALAVLLLCAGWVRGGVAVYPSVVELTVSPGKVAKGVFKVRNDGGAAQVIQVQPEVWPPGTKGDPPIASWLELRPGELELGPGREGTVHYTVRVPVSGDGELAAQVYFASAVSRAGTMPLRQRFGCAMYVRVKGTERYDVRLSSVTAHRREKETVFEIVLENKGNVHLRPAAQLEVATSTGTAVVVLEGESPIYAGTHRTFFARLKGAAQVLERGRGVIHITFQTSEGERQVSDVFTLE